MSKLEELRTLVSSLFDKAEDANTIQQYGAVKSKMDEIDAETKQQEDNYKRLLDDYKDVVIHQTVKPDKADTRDATPEFNADKTLAEVLNKFKID